MEIGLFCFHYSDRSSNQAIYQSSLPKPMYLKFASMYYVTNHYGLLGHMSFAWETIKTRTLILPGS